MTQPEQPCKCRQCGVLTATPLQGLCTICYENVVMLGQADEVMGRQSRRATS
jgi:hypothetical protein